MNKIPKTPLCKLALKYGADKWSSQYSYTPVYYKLFKNRRKSVKKVLEIGIGGGASLYMWQEFFPNAKIYGVDYRSDLQIKQDRIESFLYDQRRTPHLLNLINKIGQDIDIVIDDGSHRPRDQISTCKTLMPLLKKDVIYIIEDAADPSITEQLSKYYDVEIPKIPYTGSYDNRLVIVRHKKQTNISFFAKKPFHLPPDNHLARISSIIRGQQIADYIGAKLNPTFGYQNDICIYVKPPYKKGNDVLFEGKPYLDVIEEIGYCQLLQKHPEVGVISASDWAYQILKRLLPKNKIVNIKQHHCNFERIKRNRTQVTTVGVIGNHHLFEFLPKGLKKQLTQRNIKFIKLSKFYTRQDVIDFYMSIDVQIFWRPFYNYQKDILANPLKIINCASFGIPTIAYDEPCFQEMDGCFIPVHTLDEFLVELDKLRSNPKLYDQIAKRCIEKSEQYHIEKIAQLYRNLAFDL